MQGSPLSDIAEPVHPAPTASCVAGSRTSPTQSHACKHVHVSDQLAAHLLQRLEDVLINPEHAISKQVHDHYLPYLTEFEPDMTERDTEKEISLRNRVKLSLRSCRHSVVLIRV
jgi:hypothetical protein